MAKVNQIHTFRATQNFDTVEQWKKNNIEVSKDERKQNDGSVKTFFNRPDVIIDVEVADLSTMMESEKGQAILQKMVENLAFNVMAPFVAENKSVEEYPDLTDIDVLAKALEEKAKQSKLTATSEEMKAAADLYEQYLTEVLGKDESPAKSQSELFKGKFTKAKLNKFQANLLQRGVPVERTIEFISKLRENVVTFTEFLQTQDQEVLEAGAIPAQICLDAIDDWMESDKEDEKAEDLLSVDDF